MDATPGGLTGSLLDDRYRIGSVIARGGMSTVYRGLDTRLDRPVAVKVMAAQYADDPAFLTRFSREARLAAGLSDPGIVAVYDHGRDGDQVFLVMELVDGGTLRDLLRQHGRLSPETVVAVLGPLLGALSTAHRAGLVHRDVKPENVLISSRGQVKVADFGLVRAVSSQTMATGDVILGTVAYLSPEQVSTGAADARSDVYAAGIVAWEMLAGHPPFSGDNAMSVAYRHVHSDVPMIGDEVPDVPAPLEDLLTDATRRTPEQRPRDAAAFAQRLATVQRRLRLPPVTVPVPAATRPPPPTAGAPAPVGRTGGRRTSAAPAQPTADTAVPAGPRGTRVVADGGRATAGAPHGVPAPSGRVRRRRWPRRLIWLLVILLLGAAAAAGGWWLGSGRWASTPDTTGLTRPAAEQAMRDAGLIPEVIGARSDTVPDGRVADTDPDAGTRLLRGSRVQVVLSTGPPVVPDLEPGVSVERAERLIGEAGLTVGEPDADRPRVYTDAAPAGTVVATRPEAGTALTIGAPVLLVVSMGPRPIRIPPVAGKTVEDAGNKLLVAGFTVGTPVDGFDAAQPDGTVLGTRPAAGSTRPKGERIRLVVNASVTVPDLRHGEVGDAVRELTDDGYEVIVGQPEFDADVDGGHVTRTVPAAGTRIDPADKSVTVIGSSAVTVPQVTGDAVADAQDALTGLGLSARTAALFGLTGATVIGQSPGQGQRVPPGETIYLTVF